MYKSNITFKNKNKITLHTHTHPFTIKTTSYFNKFMSFISLPNTSKTFRKAHSA